MDCGGPKPEGVTGCALHNGTKIAILATEFVLGEETPYEPVVTLHEIGHTQGLEHNMEDGNLMNQKTSASTVAIREDQCPAFSVAKQYGAQILWEE